VYKCKLLQLLFILKYLKYRYSVYFLCRYRYTRNRTFCNISYHYLNFIILLIFRFQTSSSLTYLESGSTLSAAASWGRSLYWSWIKLLFGTVSWSCTTSSSLTYLDNGSTLSAAASCGKSLYYNWRSLISSLI
jgi:hypothetical protein